MNKILTYTSFLPKYRKYLEKINNDELLSNLETYEEKYNDIIKIIRMMKTTKIKQKTIIDVFTAYATNQKTIKIIPNKELKQTTLFICIWKLLNKSHEYTFTPYHYILADDFVSMIKSIQKYTKNKSRDIIIELYNNLLISCNQKLFDILHSLSCDNIYLKYGYKYIADINPTNYKNYINIKPSNLTNIIFKYKNNNTTFTFKCVSYDITSFIINDTDDETIYYTFNCMIKKIKVIKHIYGFGTIKSLKTIDKLFTYSYDSTYRQLRNIKTYGNTLIKIYK